MSGCDKRERGDTGKCDLILTDHPLEEHYVQREEKLRTVRKGQLSKSFTIDSIRSQRHFGIQSR